MNLKNYLSLIKDLKSKQTQLKNMIKEITENEENAEAIKELKAGYDVVERTMRQLTSDNDISDSDIEDIRNDISDYIINIISDIEVSFRTDDDETAASKTEYYSLKRNSDDAWNALLAETDDAYILPEGLWIPEPRSVIDDNSPKYARIARDLREERVKPVSDPVGNGYRLKEDLILQKEQQDKSNLNLTTIRYLLVGFNTSTQPEKIKDKAGYEEKLSALRKNKAAPPEKLNGMSIFIDKCKEMNYTVERIKNEKSIAEITIGNNVFVCGIAYRNIQEGKSENEIYFTVPFESMNRYMESRYSIERPCVKVTENGKLNWIRSQHYDEPLLTEDGKRIWFFYVFITTEGKNMDRTFYICEKKLKDRTSALQGRERHRDQSDSAYYSISLPSAAENCSKGLEIFNTQAESE